VIYETSGITDHKTLISLLQIRVCVTVKGHKTVILCKTQKTQQYERDDYMDFLGGKRVLFCVLQMVSGFGGLTLQVIVESERSQ
jgi:hypothetical protein